MFHSFLQVNCSSRNSSLYQNFLMEWVHRAVMKDRHHRELLTIETLKFLTQSCNLPLWNAQLTVEAPHVSSCTCDRIFWKNLIRECFLSSSNQTINIRQIDALNVAQLGKFATFDNFTFSKVGICRKCQADSWINGRAFHRHQRLLCFLQNFH